MDDIIARGLSIIGAVPGSGNVGREPEPKAVPGSQNRAGTGTGGPTGHGSRFRTLIAGTGNQR